VWGQVVDQKGRRDQVTILLQDLYDCFPKGGVLILEETSRRAVMTVSKLSECYLYSSAVIKPTVASTALALTQPAICSTHEEPGVLQKWILPVLTLLGTIAAMWFVVGDGWFQLFGFWGS